jgi:predicted ATPase
MPVRSKVESLVGVEGHFARWSHSRDAAGYRQAPGAVVAIMFYASYVAWTFGHADSARERIVQANAFARYSKNPYDLAYWGYLESYLYQLLREPQHADAAATQALVLCEEHGFPYVRVGARAIKGWARAQLGSAGEGVSLIRQGLAGMAEAGIRVGVTDFLTRLAEAQALDGATGEALGTIEDALQANPEEVVFRPNILTCRGELRLKIGRAELAEADFREAIALAQKMSAKAWELRATTSLARLLRVSDRCDEARTMLAEISGWFKEGFDTADLKEAKSLLNGLNE